MTAQNLDGFVFWAEPDDMEIADGLSVVVGGGEGRFGERAFLSILTPHSNARALLTADQLAMLIDWLTGMRDALTSDGAA
jgi:hypothetical protein